MFGNPIPVLSINHGDGWIENDPVSSTIEEMRETTLGLVLVVSLTAVSTSAQDSPCAGQLRTTPIGGSYYASGIAASGDLLVSVDWDSMTTWDLSDPDVPVGLGQWISSAENHAYGEKELLKLDPRGFAFVSNWYTSRIEVFDLRDRLEPTPVSRIRTRWNDFDLVGEVLVGVGSSLSILDVKDPFHPVPLCDRCLVLSDNGPPSFGDAVAMAMSADLLVTAHLDLFRVIDISDPVHPVEVSTVELTPFHGLDIRLWAGSDRAVIWSSTGMHVIDLSDPENPIAHVLDYDVYNPYWGEIHGRTLLIDEIGSFSVVDLSELGGVVDVDRVERYARSSEVVGDRLFLGTSQGIEVFDLSVRPIEELGIGRKDQTSSIVINGDVAIATGSRFARSLAFGDDGAPTVVDRLEFSGSTGRPSIDGSLVAVPLYPHGVGVFTVGTDLRLEMIGEISTEDCDVYRVDLDDGRLAVPVVCEDNSGVLDVYDVSNPSAPVRDFRFVSDEPLLDAVFDGDRLFTTRGGDLLEFDLSDPDNVDPPVVLTISEDARRIYSLAHAGECLFVGTSGAQYQAGDNILAAVDVVHPGAPSVIATAEVGPFWLTGSHGTAAGGEYWSLFLTSCPSLGDELKVTTHAFTRSVTRGGSIRNGTLYLATPHSVDELDLACIQPEADFRWYPMGTWVQFEDRTTLDGSWRGPDREWVWKFSNGRTVRGLMAPLIDFGLPGIYTATLVVTTELGISTVTKTIELPRQQGLSPNVRESGGRVVP